MYGTALNLMASAARSFDSAQSTSVRLPLQLDRVPTMLQFALDSHAVQRSHVMYQSMERWLLEGFGMAAAEPGGHFDNLMQYSIAQRALFGSSVTNFTHGPGNTGRCATHPKSTSSGTRQGSSARRRQRERSQQALALASSCTACSIFSRTSDVMLATSRMHRATVVWSHLSMSPLMV